MVLKNTHWIGVIAPWSAMWFPPQALLDTESGRRRVDRKHSTLRAAAESDTARLRSGE